MHPGLEDKIVRFGSFEADFGERKLTKGGIRIRLQEQPFLILALLLERPGQVVTREEIRQKLWAHDTFVEFDDALNTAVRKLRTALSDSADNPRFLETVPRRGYRFVAPVTMPASRSTEKTNVPDPGTVPTTAFGAVASHSQQRAKHKNGRHRLWIPAIAALVLMTAFGTSWYLRRPAFLVTPRDTIVLADFVNTTGEPVFDDALRQGLEVGLAQSPFLQVMPDRKALVVMKQMGYSPDERMSGRAAIEVCQRTGSKATVQGSIASLGTSYLVGLAAIRCDNGEPISNEQVQVKRKEEVIDALGRVVSNLRARLGESLPSIQKYNAPLEQATTPSLDALNAYGIALSTWDQKGDLPSIPLLKKTIELDPNFAMAYGALATVYHNLNEEELARVNATKAYDLRDKVTAAERVSIESRYFLYVTGDLEKAARTYEFGVQAYPQSAGAFNHLGSTYAELGEYQKAVESLRQALLLDPTRATTYTNLAVDLLALDRIQDASVVLAEADKREFQTRALLQSKYWIAFLRGDAAEMRRIVLASPDTSGAQSLLLSEQANTEAYYGHFEKARQLSHEAANQMQQNGDAESAADCLAVAALREAEIGDAGYSRDDMARAAKLANGRGMMTLSALVTAELGDLKKAETQAASLSSQYRSDTVIQGYWLPVIRAEIAMQKKNPSQAIEALKVAETFEMAGPTFSVATLNPAYTRGIAYLASGDSQKAQTEFQKLTSHPGLVLNSPLGSLAHLQLARAYSLRHDSEKGARSLSHFPRSLERS
jgi:eukaryotic-like serine/threonine-protein kinase